MSLVAAIQLSFFRAQSAADMEARLVAAIQPTVEQGAQLVVLPQYVGLTLLSAAGVGQDLVPALHKKGAALLRAYEETCAGLAARFGVWLAPGSAPFGQRLLAQAEGDGGHDTGRRRGAWPRSIAVWHVNHSMPIPASL